MIHGRDSSLAVFLDAYSMYAIPQCGVKPAAGRPQTAERRRSEREPGFLSCCSSSVDRVGASVILADG
jgi:hypothetical protein